MFNSQDDRLGLGVQERASRNYWQNVMKGGSPINTLFSPMWEGFKQAYHEGGVDKFVGGASAPGSNQIRGFSVQPDYVGVNASEQLAKMGKQYNEQYNPVPYTDEEQEQMLKSTSRNTRRAMDSLKTLGLGHY